MSNFVKEQWDVFCNSLERTAKFLATGSDGLLEEFMQSAADFYDSATPDSYQELLQSIAIGTRLAISWQDRSPRVSSSADTAYTNSENHRPIPEPTETMAGQTTKARDI